MSSEVHISDDYASVEYTDKQSNKWEFEYGYATEINGQHGFMVTCNDIIVVFRLPHQDHYNVGDGLLREMAEFMSTSLIAGTEVPERNIHATV